jgi:putative oxidoreductase
MRAIFLIGRAIFGGFFLYNGLNHLKNSQQMASYAGSKGVPAPEAAIHGTGGMLLAGGLSVIAGVKPREGLATLVAFLVPTTLQMHQFWKEQDPQQRMNELVNFSKNLALVGAALALMQIDEPWPASVDAVRNGRDEEMYVRLGGREWPALPA